MDEWIKSILHEEFGGKDLELVIKLKDAASGSDSDQKVKLKIKNIIEESYDGSLV
jgi:hypothetical protein